MSDRIRRVTGRYVQIRLFVLFGPVVFERVEVLQHISSRFGGAPLVPVWRKPRPGEIEAALGERR